jgi:hypothetical protein
VSYTTLIIPPSRSISSLPPSLLYMISPQRSFKRATKLLPRWPCKTFNDWLEEATTSLPAIQTLVGVVVGGIYRHFSISGLLRLHSSLCSFENAPTAKHKIAQRGSAQPVFCVAFFVCSRCGLDPATCERWDCGKAASSGCGKERSHRGGGYSRKQPYAIVLYRRGSRSLHIARSSSEFDGHRCSVRDRNK